MNEEARKELKRVRELRRLARERARRLAAIAKFNASERKAGR